VNNSRLQLHYLARGRGAKYCHHHHRVCIPVCLSARLSQKPHVQISRNFLYMIPLKLRPYGAIQMCILLLLLLAVARSNSDNSTICYVLPVLWMTSWSEWTRIKENAVFRLVRQVAATATKLLSSIAALFHRCFRASFQYMLKQHVYRPTGKGNASFNQNLEWGLLSVGVTVVALSKYDTIQCEIVHRKSWWATSFIYTWLRTAAITATNRNI